MIRITQRTLDPKLAGQLESLHAAFVRIIANKLPPSVAALYAVPKAAADGTVQWTTHLTGQPRPYAELPVAEAARLKTLLFERLSALRQHAEALAQQPSHDVAAVALLKHASAEPPIEAIYAVNGQPVLLFWDQALPSNPKRQLLAAPVVPVIAVAADQVAPSTWSKGIRWLLALVLLLIVLFLLWWFFCPKSWRLHQTDQVLAPNVAALTPPVIHREPPPLVSQETQRPTPPPPEVLTPTEPLTPPESPVVRKPADPPVPSEEAVPPLVEVPEPEAELLRPPAPPVEQPKPEKPVVVPPKVEAPLKPPVPKVITVDNAKTVCPEDRPAALAPELIVVFDASGSMRININATQDEEDWVISVMNNNSLNRLSPSERQKFMRLHQEPTRIMTAKQATISLLQRLPKDVGTGLVVVDDCPTARNLGRFAPSERGQMIAQLSQLAPNRGTPLADGLLQGGELADGVNKESTILLVSDGEESCSRGANVCYVARNLKRQKPHLKVNVIDIGGAGAANCAAELTGGKVYTVNSVKELNIGIDRAAQDALGPAQCKK
jgi:hypothetical protein